MAESIPCGQQLSADHEWALREASAYFASSGSLQQTLRQLAQRLTELNISYAIIGGMAWFRYGYRRFTEHVDVLVTVEGLEDIHEHLVGKGYIQVFQGSRSIRDAETNVRIEFVVTGTYPRDGKKKPVEFPDPAAFGADFEGGTYIRLEKLVELKLASGISNAGRLRDLADVLEVIRGLKLPKDFASHLEPSVRDTYTRLWQDAAAKSGTVTGQEKFKRPCYQASLQTSPYDIPAPE